MNGSEIKINERSGEENKVLEEIEEIKLPSTVFNANWRDDIPEQAKEENEAIGLEPYEREAEYSSKEEVSQEAEERIKLFNIRKIGLRTARFVPKEELDLALYGEAA